LEARASVEKFPGGGGNGIKDRKIARKKRKIALLSLFQGGNGKKERKIVKIDRKIALLNLYLLYLCHV